MNKTQYQQYLRSDHWIKFKHKYSVVYKRECYLCGEHDRLELHHVTYDRLGKERMTDVVYLCGRCHDLIHESGAAGNKARQWLDPKKYPATKQKDKEKLFGGMAAKKPIITPRVSKKENPSDVVPLLKPIDPSLSKSERKKANQYARKQNSVYYQSGNNSNVFNKTAEDARSAKRSKR